MATPEITDVELDVDGKAIPVFNKEALASVGMELEKKYKAFEADRVPAEQQWMQNARQRLGIYDADLLKEIGPNRSKAYPKVTRAKCVSMLSKLMNLLFPVGDENWTVEPSEIPNLDKEDLDLVLQKLMDGKDPNADLTDEEIEQAIREFAAIRGKNLANLITDQLSELGGDRTLNYTRLCRAVLKSGIEYGIGVLSGPFVDEKEVRTWTTDLDGKPVAVTKTVSRPLFEYVPIWDYYPDLSARYFIQMSGQFHRKVMSKHQFIALKQRDDFIVDQINNVLELLPNGNYQKKSFEIELTSHGVQSNTAPSTDNKGKYEVMVWLGFWSGRKLKELGITIPEDRLNDDVRAHIWFVKNTVIKAVLDPWSDLLGPDETVEMFHQFIFEEDETSIIGQGLPQIVRDSQLGICAGTRMVLDNSSIQRNFELNTSMLMPDQDMTTTSNDKIWYRDDDGPTANTPAFKVIDIPSRLTEMQAIIALFQSFADQETFVNAATGGDMQKGPSEPFRTAAGASMLRGEAALPYKDVVRNFDVFTESVIRSLIQFNKVFNEPDNQSIRGDFQAIARGATSLIAKEVLGIQLDNLASTLTDEEKKYVDFRKLAILRVKVRDLESSDVIVDEIEARRIDEAEAQANAEARQLQTQQLSATLRETLAKTLKDMSLANKNQAAAEAQTAGVILDSLEEGLNATEQISDGEGTAGESPAKQLELGTSGLGEAAEAATEQIAGGVGAVPARSVPAGAGQGAGI